MGTTDQVTADIQFLFTQLFDVNGNKTLAYDSSTQAQAVANFFAAANYLAALQANNGAGILALNALTGQNLPLSGPLTGTPDQITAEIQFLFTQLFDVNGNKTLAYDSSTQAQAVANLIAAANYLAALQANDGAGILALNGLSGQNLPMSGPLTGTPDQITAEIQFLFTQLFDVNGNKTLAYDSATQAQAVTEVQKAAAYLAALRANGGAGLTALEELTGQKLPTDGALSYDQIQYLFTQLFDTSGNPTNAYNQPTVAVEDLVRAEAYLEALRSTSGALSVLKTITGQTLPSSGPLTPDQVQVLFKQLFDASGNPTLAYNNPTEAAKQLASAQKSSNIGLFVLGGVLAGVLTAALLNISGASLTVTALAGTAVTGAVIASAFLFGGSKGTPVSTPTSSITSLQAPALKLLPPAISSVNPATGGNAAATPQQATTQGTNVSQLTVVEPHAMVVGASAPDKAYVSLNPGLDGVVQNPDAIKASYAQGRWLATANGNNASPQVSPAAMGYAGPANKTIGIINPSQNNPADLNQ